MLHTGKKFPQPSFLNFMTLNDEAEMTHLMRSLRRQQITQLFAEAFALQLIFMATLLLRNAVTQSDR